MVNNTANVNRANVIVRKIQRIIVKNNPNGRVMPDAEDNDDKKVFVNTAKNVNPKDVAREMVNLVELFNQLRTVVEGIDDIGIKMNFEDEIDVLENMRRDIRNENQDIVNDKMAADGRPMEARNAGTFLEFEGGGNGVFKDWT
jgi:hypothetical protein